MRSMFVMAMPFLMAAAPTWQQQALASAAPFIDKANEDWTRAIVSRDSEQLATPYDTNGIFVGPDGSVSIGKAAVKAMYAARPTSVRVLKAAIKSDGRVAHDADDVYEWGTAIMTVQRGTEVRQASGHYLTVWHRSGNRWLITRNMAF